MRGPQVMAGYLNSALLASFRDYLLTERGLALSTARAYVLRAHRFLDSRGPGVGLVGLTAADVTRAVLGQAGTGAVGSTQFFSSWWRCGRSCDFALSRAWCPSICPRRR